VGVDIRAEVDSDLAVYCLVVDFDFDFVKVGIRAVVDSDLAVDFDFVMGENLAVFVKTVK
jgi:hypothetical protein